LSVCTRKKSVGDICEIFTVYSRTKRPDYHNTSAQYNPLKLTSGESGLTSFWEYWNYSAARRLTAILLISFILIGAAIAFIAPYGS